MSIIKSLKRNLHQLVAGFSPKQDFLLLNKKSKIKQCYICGEQFEHFYKYRINSDTNTIVNYFQPVGSDVENFGCYYCNCNDRERHLFMYFDRLGLWNNITNSTILHFAPEAPLIKKIESLNPKEYIKCDLLPKEDWQKVDITNINFPENHFDIIICNHVLEHVPDHIKALQEMSHVLKNGGWAILQTPYSELLYNHFEDSNINTDARRLIFYGQEDHVRVLSKRQFFDELSSIFNLKIVENKTLISDEECFRYGVNKKEDLIMVDKQKSPK